MASKKDLLTPLEWEEQLLILVEENIAGTQAFNNDNRVAIKHYKEATKAERKLTNHNLYLMQELKRLQTKETA